ncbi:prolyl oligopeptidase family serine peptidase [Streptomyces sp. JJ66]|uniref:alpha/beta fold hydrolase n=1 Tax=Streptomyces sp. JJ66 TaxID=2803843 RepID=UPI001C58E48D|nr:alpha/beta fold hydrolase [Streptomyces sp. JJ66]MBW1604475.1 prolyl oligopeptidase family serine peptidase [Streptomyces sp. JJ66]
MSRSHRARRPRGTRRSRAVVGTVSVALLAGAAVGVGPTAHAGPTGGAPSAVTASAGLPTEVRFVDIAGHEGVRLAANVVAPADTSTSHPVLVFPTSWSMPQIEYLAQAKKLAARGYVVVSYNVRGFWESGGEIEVAGPEDIADASKVIDWALANTAADPEQIGMGGISYGAGISLLTAAADPRVDAVAALSGWADLVESLYSGQTQHTQATALLTGLGYLTGRPSEETAAMMERMLSGKLDGVEEVIAWAEKRSATHQVDRLNANGTAVYLANAWGDSFFSPNQYADFYEKLSGPKRLEFRPGDHATAEGLGLLGLPNDVWTNTQRWFDHHLKGVNNGIGAEPPVRIKPRGGGAYESYSSWKDVPARSEVLDFSHNSEHILSNGGSGAHAGISFLSNLLDQFVHTAPKAYLPLLPGHRAAKWQGDRLGTEREVRGTATVETTVTSSHASGTAVAYLYSVSPLGFGELITHAPATFHGQTPGRAFPLDIELFATAYDVPAGHRIALVIDGVDTLYTDHNSFGQSLVFRDTELTVPLG